jgi:hypothetical protein
VVVVGFEVVVAGVVPHEASVAAAASATIRVQTERYLDTCSS